MPVLSNTALTRASSMSGNRVAANSATSLCATAGGNDAATATSSGCRECVVLESVTEILLRELTDRRLRHFIDEDDIVGQPPARDTAVEELEDVFLRNRRALADDDARQRPLGPFRVSYADHGGLGHVGVGHDLVLEL